MAATSRHSSADGVHTYRGHTIDEIIPQIRSELGPDAIILREREGVVGGVGGFFGQRFVEVEARRGKGGSIDIYDDMPEYDLRPVGKGPVDGVVDRKRPVIDDDVIEVEPLPEPDDQSDGSPRRTFVDDSRLLPPAQVTQREPQPPEPRRRRRTREEIADEVRALRERPVTAPEPQLFTPRVVKPSPKPEAEPAPNRASFETGVFMQRLREASAELPEVDEPEPDTPLVAPLAPKPAAKPKSTTARKPAAAKPKTAAPTKAPAKPAAAKPRATTTPKSATAAKRAPASPARSAAPPRAAAKAKAASAAVATSLAAAPAAATPAAPAPTASTRAKSAPAPRAKVAPAPRLQPPARTRSLPQTTPEPQNPYSAVRTRPESVQTSVFPARQAASAPAPEPAAAAALPVPIPRTQNEGSLRQAIARIFRRRSAHARDVRRPAPKPLDPIVASDVTEKLTTRGASAEFATQLLTTAGAHAAVLTGDLRGATEAELARRIVPVPPLPVTGAAIAFIGAGGSGKTSCAAALASAYSRNSTLDLSVITLDSRHGGRELQRLLSPDGVKVQDLNGDRARQQIASGREGGVVIIDMPAVNPSDPGAVAKLGELLDSLSVDAAYLTMPATLGPQAASRSLMSFGALNPSALAITHTDETDQLATVLEIAISQQIPLAFFHSGTDVKNALSAIDAAAVARDLLP